MLSQGPDVEDFESSIDDSGSKFSNKSSSMVSSSEFME